VKWSQRKLASHESQCDGGGRDDVTPTGRPQTGDRSDPPYWSYSSTEDIVSSALAYIPEPSWSADAKMRYPAPGAVLWPLISLFLGSSAAGKERSLPPPLEADPSVIRSFHVVSECMPAPS